MLPKIEHPVFDLKIPSNKKKIKVRPMLVKEEKILLMAKEGGNISEILDAIKQVVSNCIQDDTLDIDTLAIFDIEYLFMRIRALSVNNIVSVSYRDGEDEKSYDFQLDLNTIEVKFPEKSEKNIKIDGDINITLRYPSAKDYSKLENMSYDDLLNASIETVFEGDKAYQFADASEEEKKYFVDNMPIESSNKIKEFLNNMPSLWHEIKYKNSLGNDRTITLSNLNDFFDLR